MAATTRDFFALYVGQQVTKDFTDEQINELTHDPEKMAAYIAGLKPPMPTGGSMAPLHVGTLPRVPMLPSLNDEHSVASVEQVKRMRRSGGVELPLETLEPEDDEHTEASAESVRSNPSHKGAELPPVSALPVRLDGLEDWQRADRVRGDSVGSRSRILPPSALEAEFPGDHD